MHEIKRASLERDFMHRPSADGVINIHTTRHKSSTQLKHTPKRHHPATKQPSLPRLVQTYLINRGHHALHQPPTQNAMPQASICPEADYLKKKKSAVQYAVG